MLITARVSALRRVSRLIHHYFTVRAQHCKHQYIQPGKKKMQQHSLSNSFWLAKMRTPISTYSYHTSQKDTMNWLILTLIFTRHTEVSTLFYHFDSGQNPLTSHSSCSSKAHVFMPLLFWATLPRPHVLHAAHVHTVWLVCFHFLYRLAVWQNVHSCICNALLHFSCAVQKKLSMGLT